MEGTLPVRPVPFPEVGPTIFSVTLLPGGQFIEVALTEQVVSVGGSFLVDGDNVDVEEFTADMVIFQNGGGVGPGVSWDATNWAVVTESGEALLPPYTGVVSAPIATGTVTSVILASPGVVLMTFDIDVESVIADSWRFAGLAATLDLIVGSTLTWGVDPGVIAGDTWECHSPWTVVFVDGGTLNDPFSGTIDPMMMLAGDTPLTEEPPQKFFERRRKQRKGPQIPGADRPDP
jgi:hypothetical protein